MKNINAYRSVNWHVLRNCNYKCKFCLSAFNDIEKILSKEASLKILEELRNFGAEKITFTGGEPLLHPFLGSLLIKSKELDLTTMIVTNGSLLSKEFLDRHHHRINWIGLSVESTREEIEKRLGRGNGNHLKMIKQKVKLIRNYDIKLKINCVVNSLNYRENLSKLLDELRPNRLKFLQVLEIKGENDHKVKPFLITEKQFQYFVDRHKAYSPIAENNRSMKNSYLMLDPLGRFFQNNTGTIRYSKSILETKAVNAIREVGWDKKKFKKRGGYYDW